MTGQGDLVPGTDFSHSTGPPLSTSLKVLLGCILGAVVLFTFGLLSLGIDLTDESYYVAMALRFALGDQPFVDELFINQTSAILIYPVLKAFLFFRGGLDGIVYFSRIFYFLFSGLVTVTIIWSLRERVRTEFAIAASLLYLAFIPCRIPNLSYNTFGLGFLTMGLFLGLRQAEEGGRFGMLAAGLSLGLSVVCYPGMILGVVAFLLALLVLKGRKGVFAVVGGGIIAVSLFIPSLWAGASAIGDVVAYSTGSYGHGGGLDKLVQLFAEFGGLLITPERIPSLLLLLLLFLLQARFPAAAGLVLVALLLSLLWLSPHPVFGIELHRLAIEVGLLSLPFYFLIPAPVRLRYRSIVWIIWMPSLAAGVGAGWSTVNGVLNAIIGGFPMVIVGMLLMMEWAHHTAVSRGKIGRSFPLYLPALLCFLFLLAVYVKPYRDDLTSRLNTRISSGPYRGLYTTDRRKADLEILVRDIESLQMGEGKIIFYDFPAGYLLVPRRSAARNTWMRKVSKGKKFYIDYYKERLSPHNLVVHVGPEVEHDEWRIFVENTHDLRLSRPGYRIYALRNSGKNDEDESRVKTAALL